ncbi:hypothetical protein [Nocardia bovistercoris]|uniref:hypothetical protein n=1 Tax=Nocardia bovistercoris TaxID=2785916 RepID=UPI001E547F1B|nr:hypothetical protein [Nocardia bovistercoris]
MERWRELEELRKKMAAIPARGTAAATRMPRAAESRHATLAVPPALAELLPDGGLAKGSVVAYAGARSLLAGLLAAATEDGGHAAVVGMPRFGLLAAVEMGAELARIAVIADPGPDPVEIASVLLDGLDLVVLGLGNRAVPPSRSRVIAARARTAGATLVVADGHWPDPGLRLESRVCEYSGLGAGHGRLRSLSLDVGVRARTGRQRRGRIDLCPNADRVEWVARGRAATEMHGRLAPEMRGRLAPEISARARDTAS